MAAPGRKQKTDLFAAWVICKRGHAARPSGVECILCRRIWNGAAKRKQRAKIKKAFKARKRLREGTQSWVKKAKIALRLYLECWKGGPKEGYTLPRSALGDLQEVREMAEYLCSVEAGYAKGDYKTEREAPYATAKRKLEGKPVRRFKD